MPSHANIRYLMCKREQTNFVLQVISLRYICKTLEKIEVLKKMSSRPRLLIVTSKRCGACNTFKSNVLPDLRKKLATLDIKVDYVDLPDFGTGDLVNLAPEYPATVQPFIGSFPTFLYFPAGSWIPTIFNSKIENGVGKPDKYPRIPYTVDGIFDWVKSQAPSPTVKGKLVPSLGPNVKYSLTRGGVPVQINKGPRYIKRDND